MAAKASETVETSGLPDCYLVLGVPATATGDEIRLAYRKLALQWHPDKHRGGDADAAAERFQEIAASYSILSDVEKRRKYDAGGAAALDATDMEIDVSSLGTAGTMLAATFSKMGFKIKTAVSQTVLTAAYDGAILAHPLQWGELVSDKVDKQGANWYALEVSQEHIDAGFVVSAYSSAASKFKLLLFEKTPEGVNELVAQEECFKVKKQTVAGLYFLHMKTCDVGAVQSSMELGGVPEAVLFRRLDRLKERETPNIKPGQLLLAVYGDNWFQKASYTLETHIMMPGNAQAADTVQVVDAQVMAKRGELHTFEKSFNKVQADYVACLEQFSAEKRALDTLLEERDAAYLQLLQVPAEGITAVVPNTGMSNPATVANRFLGKLWSGSKNKE